jgi:hypothetical protein
MERGNESCQPGFMRKSFVPVSFVRHLSEYGDEDEKAQQMPGFRLNEVDISRWKSCAEA